MNGKNSNPAASGNGDAAPPTGKSKPKQNFKALLPDTPGEMLCFDRSEFVRLDFCVDEFVAECRKRVHLEQLRQDLEKYFKRLKGAMIDLINKDYHEFVSLSAHLADLDKQLVALRKPLNDITTDTSESRCTLDTELASLMKLLKSRHEEATRSRLIQNAIAVLNKLETAESSFAKFREDTDNVKMLEKSIDAYNITRHHADLTSQFPTTQQAHDRIKFLESELITVTERELLNTLGQARSNKQAKVSQEGTQATVDLDLVQKIQLLLTSAMLLNSVQRVEKSIQEKLVAPAVRRLIEDYKATGKHISLKVSELSRFFKSLLTLLEDPCGLLIEISSGRHSSVSGIPAYDFAVRAIWPEIVDQVQSNIPHLFMVTNLQDFHTRYGIAKGFLSDFERRCGSQASVKRLRSSAKYISWGSSWPLMAYFTRVQKNHSMQYEEQLSITNKGTTVVSACKDLFSEDVFIDRLTARFWRLCVYFLTHYVATVQTSLAPPATTESTSKPATSVPSLVEKFIDLDQLERKLPEIATVIAGKLPQDQHAQEEHAPMTSKFFSSVTVQIGKTRDIIVDVLMSELSELSLVQLGKAKDVPRLYRRTNREPPKETSQYVEASFSKMEQVVKNEQLPEELKLRLATHCAVSCAPKFELIVEDVLSNVRKMEESLIKLQKIRKKPQQSKQSGVTDDYKIRLQLKLDLEAVVNRYTRDYGVECSKELVCLENIARNIGTMLNDSSRTGDS